MRELVLDTETTGLDHENGDRIVEIGIIELKNHIKTGNFFHYYINPERKSDPKAEQVHGLSQDFLSLFLLIMPTHFSSGTPLFFALILLCYLFIFAVAI